MFLAIPEMRQAARRWRAKPAFALTAVLTLTLGIGVVTAIFSVVDAVVLRPLPWPRADRLVTPWIVRPQWRVNPALAASAERGSLSFPNFRDLQQARTLASVAIWTTRGPILDGPTPEEVPATEVSSTFLDTLGVRVIAGRNFLPSEDDDPSGSVIVSFEGWQRRFGGDPEIIGRAVTLDEAPRTIVGVLPPRFRFHGEPPEFLLPLGVADKRGRNRGNHTHRGLARLADGATLEQAHLETEPILRMDEDPRERTSMLLPLADYQLAESRRPLLALLGAATLLMLVACANVAGLLLGDVRSRRTELAVRAALGAGRWTIARQLLSESLTLSVVAALGGLVLAALLMPLLTSLAPASMPRVDEIAMNRRVFAFALLLGVLTTIACAAGAALAATGTGPAAALAEGGRSGMSRSRAQGVIVVSEIALAMVLLAGASLFAETVRRLGSEPTGFDPGNLLVLNVRAPMSMIRGVPPAARARRTAEIEAALALVPGVVSAAGTSSAPFAGGYGGNGIEIEGRSFDPKPSARRQIVTDAFFRTMGMPVLRGRAFNSGDTADMRQAVISQDFERRYFDGDAVGKRFKLNDDWMHVIGVVGNMKQVDLTDEAEPTFFALSRQLSSWWVNQYVVRSDLPPDTIIPSLRRAIRDYDSRLLLESAEPMAWLLTKSMAEERYRALLASLFGASGLLLAAIGLYGLLARDVADRRREIGLRMALGARPADVIRMIGRQGMGLVALGLLAGVPAAVGTGRLVASLLYGVEPGAPGVLLIVVAVLAAAAVLATIIPARRASRVDPMVALRSV